uniref:Uncharacterized protein n=1 Tax=Acrobeloides nanus TaxID=290746 RepID=A0A914DF65_9BILA
MFPTRHPFIGRRNYLVITLIVASFYSLSLLLVGYWTMIENPNREVVCVVIGEIYQARAKVIWVVVQVVLVFLIIGVYGIFWVYVKFTKGKFKGSLSRKNYINIKDHNF